MSSVEQIASAIQHHKLYVILAASLMLAIVVLAPRGCSDRLTVYPVSGRVVFPDGNPVRTGTIEFESEVHGTTATGRISEDGHFALGTYAPTDGAVAGSHKAIVTQMVITDGTIKHEKDHGLPVAYKYRRYETSGLTFTVEPGGSNALEVLVEPEVEANGSYSDAPN